MGKEIVFISLLYIYNNCLKGLRLINQVDFIILIFSCKIIKKEIKYMQICLYIYIFSMLQLVTLLHSALAS